MRGTLHFNSLGELAIHLVEAQAHMVLSLHHGLERASKLVERTAKSEFGVYQPQQGPFPAWAPLAESTLERKEADGSAPPDNPLVHSGDLRDSIEHEVVGHEAVIGTKDPLMVFHEFGTSKMPARPVLGPAAFRNKEHIKRILGEAMVEGLLGGESIHPSLGYDYDTK